MHYETPLCKGVDGDLELCPALPGSDTHIGHTAKGDAGRTEWDSRDAFQHHVDENCVYARTDVPPEKRRTLNWSHWYV